MKVLFLVSGVGPPAGWGTEFIQNLIFKLSKKGVEATILTPIYQHTHPDWKNWIQKIEKQYKVKIYTFNLPDFIQRNLILYLGLVPILTTFYTIKLLKEKQFDIIHEFSSTPIILLRALVLKILFKIPTVYTYSVFNNTLLGKFFWFKVFNFAKFYFIPSRNIILTLQNIGINASKIVYSPPGIRFHKKYGQLNQNSSRKALSLPKDKFIFSYFGPLSEEKGVLDLIEAAKIINQQTKDKIIITLYVVWKGSSQHQKIKDYIQSLKMDHVLLKEEYVDIPTLLSASDFIILPQQTGHGTTIPAISIIEAFAAHRPVIATSIIGTNELVSSKVGFLIKSHSPAALSQTINNIVKSKFKTNGKLSCFATRDFNQAVKDFGLNKSINLHLKIYRQALNNLS